jgi:predicted lipid carrier protein YhbT
VHGGPDWQRVRVPATECARISKEFLEEERGHQRGDFEMEYMCEFRDDGLSVFSRDLVEKALDGNVKALVVEPLLSSWK